MKILSNLIRHPFFGPTIFLLVYFITPIFITQFFNPTNLSNKIFYVIVVILFILISEIIFIFTYKVINNEYYKKKSKIPFEKIIVSPHPNLPFILKKNSPPMVEKKKLSFTLNKNSYFAPALSTNNLGYLNGPDGGRDVLIPKPKGLFRVNCLGESNTQYYLSDKNGTYSWPLELEKILKKKKLNLEVNNCGTGSYTSSDLLVRFLLQIADTSPDVVVIYHAYTDIRTYLTKGFESDYSHSRKNLGEEYYKYYFGSLLPYVSLNFINFIQNKWFPQNHRYSLVESISQGEIDVNTTDVQKGLLTYERNIQNIITICKARNIEVMLCTYCYYLHEKVKDSKIHKTYENIVSKTNNIIKKLSENNNIKLVDACKLIPKNNKNFVDVVHFSPEGMKSLANIISEKIKLD